MSIDSKPETPENRLGIYRCGELVTLKCGGAEHKLPRSMDDFLRIMSPKHTRYVLVTVRSHAPEICKRTLIALESHYRQETPNYLHGLVH